MKTNIFFLLLSMVIGYLYSDFRITIVQNKYEKALDMVDRQHTMYTDLKTLYGKNVVGCQRNTRRLARRLWTHEKKKRKYYAELAKEMEARNAKFGIGGGEPENE